MRTDVGGSIARPLRVLVVDYAGHPFQFELAGELGRRGFQVDHTYCSSTLTPQARFAASMNVEVHPIDVGRNFSKYHVRRRLVDELRYGWRTVRLAHRTAPDRLLTSNVPLISLLLLWVWSAVSRTPWVLWLQDIQSGLAANVAARPTAGRLLQPLERFLLRRARRIVVISSEFRDEVLGAGVAPHRVELIENWAPLVHLPVRPKDNAWAVRHELDDRFVFLYSGTLGKKHSPELLLALADEFRSDDDVRVVVVAEGTGAEWLAEQTVRGEAGTLVLMPFQPFESLPDVLATGDVLLALLDAGAGGFSVPSKTLSYLCAGRAVLAAVPPENEAARLLTQRAHAGVAVPAGDEQAFRDAARRLKEDATARAQHGRRARAYAEETFDAAAIADRFERVLDITPPGHQSHHVPAR